MKHFTSVSDVSNLDALIDLTLHYKQNPLADVTCGHHKTIGLIFMNASLRTRLSTQKAAMNLGMNSMVMNFSGEGWALETESGVVMNGDKAEHIKEAAGVVGEYFDVIAIRSFPKLKDRDADYQDKILKAFIQHSGKPVISLEGSTLHPLQSLTDVATIKEYCSNKKPKVVLTWAPHPKALPQSVANSFAEWVGQTDAELVITHPPGFELAEHYAKNGTVEYDQNKAFQDADVIYAKNWSSYANYGQTLQDDNWMVTQEKMTLTNQALFMHCLPVRRNVVVADNVIDSQNSIVIPQAGNRTFAAQAVIKSILDHSVK